MLKTRVISSTVFLASFAFAATAVAQDWKPAAPVAPVAKPVAAPAAPAVPAAPMKPAAPSGAVTPKTVNLAGAAKAADPAAPAKIAAPAAASASGSAAPPAPITPPMPEPSKELGAFMKGFDGAWRCDSRFAAGAMGPGAPEMNLKSIVRIKKEFGGFSWHGEYTLPKSKMMPALTGIFQIGYDSGSNQATIVAYDNMGTAAMGVGPIVGDSVTFVEEGYSMGMKMKLRETMSKKSPKEIYHKYEMDMGKGFQTMGEDTCKQ